MRKELMDTWPVLSPLRLIPALLVGARLLAEAAALLLVAGAHTLHSAYWRCTAHDGRGATG